MNPMERAVQLARKALGTTSPNPAVGAVIVKEGRIIGEGYTLPPGQRHAEIGALEQAGSSAGGATLYTTLEPCCNFGRTPPCTQAVIAAGLRKVVVGAIDPNPQVSGQGIAELEAAGIEVDREESAGAKLLYEAFAKHINTGQPFVIAKFAMSLDGKIATHTGDSKWVTGPQARELVQQLRRESDAVMVGINTVLADDPQLTARDGSGVPLERQPLRVVLDSQGRTPTDARLLREPGSTIIVVTNRAPAARVKGLREAGAELLVTPSEGSGMVDLQQLLAALGQREVVSLLVEGGGGVLGSLFDGSLVDKLYAFIAPVVIGGSGAASPVEGMGAIRMAETWQITNSSMQHIGPDWLITGYPARGN
ncbi:MAG: bifunctional diaminohydroxyphosphoribosylaminopyrimidine deaminase/5-amino-6-(5-phosphoribosylamino)uracil reductase RibD [Dehalococcoidia bacterium]